MGEKPYDIKDRTFEFGTEIIKFSFALEKRYGGIKAIANQLLRAGTSVGANIEEAYGTYTDADFLNRFTIALKEARETSYWLRQIIAANIAPELDPFPLLLEIEELKKIVGSMIANKRRND